MANIESGESGAGGPGDASAVGAPAGSSGLSGNAVAALYVPTADGVRATEYTRGPWAHQVMHGGAICGLLGWAAEREQRSLGISQVCTRLTVEILSGMPMDSYEVVAKTVKAGKRTALIDAEVRSAPSGRLVARASSQWLTPTSATEEPPSNSQMLPSIPQERADPGSNPDIEYPRPGFNADAVDFRFVGGSTEEPGPGQSWARLDIPLVAGEETSTLARVVTLSDLGAAVGWDFSPSGGAYINTDVTLQLLRQPSGEWFYFDAATVVAPRGLAGTHTSISDQHGHLGWVLQSQVEAPEEIGFPGGMAASRKAALREETAR